MKNIFIAALVVLSLSSCKKKQLDHTIVVESSDATAMYVKVNDVTIYDGPVKVFEWEDTKGIAVKVKVFGQGSMPPVQCKISLKRGKKVLKEVDEYVLLYDE
jgi:ferredoxin-fold anticodon binding domain-containing protein